MTANHDPDDWHAHRLFVTETLTELRTTAEDQRNRLDELQKAIGDLKIKVAVISSSVSMAGTYVLNWIVEHHK